MTKPDDGRLRRRLLVVSLSGAGLAAPLPARAARDSNPRDRPGFGGYRYRPEERR